jgi:glutamine amidotransferase-like uncharacterized protein
MGSSLNVYSYYKAVNRDLARGQRIYFCQQQAGCSFFTVSSNHDRVLEYPRIGIYMGRGASHSWLWFVDIFDRMGFYDLAILDEAGIQGHGLEDLDVIVMSGGDTFAMAEGLSATGAKKLRGFVHKGGLYIGSCAGAYLPLRSSKKHLNLFNYVNAKITNLTRILPEAKKLPEKFCTPYGCSFIFHPVREEVKLKTNEAPPFRGVGSVFAPLYGGPAMMASESVDVLAHYEAFTGKTIFLVDNEIASNTLIGKAAAIRSMIGSGYFYLFGPHFEHPHFPLANKLLADVIYWGMRDATLKRQNFVQNIETLKGEEARKSVKDIKREISNSRIVALGVEMMPLSWLIGKKIYGPAHIRVFLETMLARFKHLDKWEELRIKNGEVEKLVKYGSRTTILLRNIKKNAEKGLDTSYLGKKIFDNLKIMSAIFFDVYFRTASARFRC